MRTSVSLLIAGAAFFLAACGGGGGGGSSSAPPPSFTVGGTVSGLDTGKSVVLSNSGGSGYTVSANGAFTLPTAVPSGSSYSVTVIVQPPGQSCSVANGSGTATSNVTSIVVGCTSLAVTVSGTIAAAAGTVADSDVNDPNAAYAPNDGFGQWQNIPNPATVGGYVNQAGFGDPGRSETAGDASDLFRVSLAAGQVLTLTVGNVVGGDVDLFLGDEAGNLIASSEGVDVTEVIAVPLAGTYVIEVYAFDGASNYILTLGQAVGGASTAAALSVTADFVPGELIARFDPVAAKKTGAPALGDQLAAKGMRMTASEADATQRPVLITLDESARSALAAQAAAETGKTEVLPVSIVGKPELERKWRTLGAIKQLRKQPGVRYAEPNFVLKASAVPNDPAYRYQWHYPMINLPQAWNLTTGSNAVIVAVIDTGVLLSHPDLQGRLVGGYDFISDPINARDGDGRDGNPDDPGDRCCQSSSSFHGTHVAGTISAATNNAAGVAGVSWNARIMPLRVLGQFGGSNDDINQAILYAARLPNASGTLPAQRADIVNMSLGGPGFSQAQQDVVTQARNQGVIVIAAAGNEASKGNPIGYPAAYSGVVSVGAVTMDRSRAPYSSFNAFVDMSAPGGDTSTDRNGDGYSDGVLSAAGDDSAGALAFAYRILQGTSMAAPHVAGVAALMKSVNPSLTPVQFDSLLASGQIAQDLGPAGRDDQFGYGLVDAHKAVVAAQSDPTPVPASLVVTPNGLNFSTLGTVATLSLVNGGGGSLTVTSAADDAAWLTLGAASDPVTGLGTRTVTVSRAGLAVGTYSATVTFISTASVVQVPVIMQVSAGSIAADAGHHYVLLIDPATGDSANEAEVSASNGLYQFSIPDVAPGSYYVLAGSDYNNDFYICDPGEACGAWPNLDSLGTLEVSGNASGVNFITGLNTVIQSQSADSPDPAQRWGYSRSNGRRVAR